jgi:phage-related protein
MDNIYNIPNYAAATVYAKNAVVKYTGTFNSLSLTNAYLYCLETHTSGGSIDATKWAGVVVFNGRLRNHFIWEPDYNSSVNPKPRVRKLTFGDGYELRMEDGINASLISYNLTFSQRKQTEAAAIAHFLENNKAVHSFVFKGRPPYLINKLYVCDEFTIEEVFMDNYTVNAVFREVTT